MQKQNSQWRLLIKNKLKNYFLKIHIKKLVIKKNNNKKKNDVRRRGPDKPSLAHNKKANAGGFFPLKVVHPFLY